MRPLLLSLAVVSCFVGFTTTPSSADDGCVKVRRHVRDGKVVEEYERSGPGAAGCAQERYGLDSDGSGRLRRHTQGNGGGYPLMPLEEEFPEPHFDGREMRGSRSIHHGFGTNPCVMIPRNFPAWQYDRNLVRFMKGACPGFEGVQLLEH